MLHRRPSSLAIQFGTSMLRRPVPLMCPPHTSNTCMCTVIFALWCTTQDHNNDENGDDGDNIVSEGMTVMECHVEGNQSCTPQGKYHCAHTYVTCMGGGHMSGADRRSIDVPNWTTREEERLCSAGQKPRLCVHPHTSNICMCAVISYLATI